MNAFAKVRQLDASRLRSYTRVGKLVASGVAEAKPHGVRARYIAGCRCLLCRAANSRYSCSRDAAIKAGDWNGIVPADAARRHLLQLSKAGIGKRAVRDACDVGYTIICQVRTGKRMQIRKSTEQKILAVTADAANDRSLIDAGPAWNQIRELLSEGFTKTALSQRLGYARSIQFPKDRMTAANVAKVDKLYRTLMAE